MPYYREHHEGDGEGEGDIDVEGDAANVDENSRSGALAAGTATTTLTLALTRLPSGTVTGGPLYKQDLGLRDRNGTSGQEGLDGCENYDDDDGGDDGTANYSSAILASVYERYATLYPNPDLANEVAERERLLRAVRAASAAVASASAISSDGRGVDADASNRAEGSQVSRRRSWWGRLFSKPQERNGGTVTAPMEDETNLLEYYSDSSEDEDDIDLDGDGDLTGRRSASLRRHLLGTQWSLDASCIPEEAVSYARFHLTCGARRERRKGLRHRGQDNAPDDAAVHGGGGCSSWNVARMVMAPSTATAAPTDGSVVVIVGLGRVLEYGSENHAWTHQATSDGDALALYWGHRRRQQLQHGYQEAWDPSHARASFFPPNVLAVAWGIPGDPVVVFYVRTGRNQNTPSRYAWEARAVIGPCDAVQASLGSMFDVPDGMGNSSVVDHGESDDNRLLTVTGIVPLPIAAPETPNPTSLPANPVTLAIGRLGGTIELVAVPVEALHARGDRKPSGSAKRQAKAQRHYANKLADVLARKDGTSAVVALTTSEWHVDIMCLDAIPVHPSAAAATTTTTTASAQFVLVATGRKNHDFRGEALSFWNVTVVKQLAVARGQVPVRMDATILASLDVGELGPEATLFASPALYRHWRRPLRVRLRQGDGPGGEAQMPGSRSQESAPPPRVTTISTPAPVTMIRSYSSESQCFVSILDSNGGVQAVDCCTLVQRLRQFDYPHNSSMTAADMPTVLVDRAQVEHCLRSSALQLDLSAMSPPFVIDLCWFALRFNRESPPMLALCENRPLRLAMLSMPMKADIEVQAAVPPVLLPSRYARLTMKADRDGTLTLLCGCDSYAAGGEEAYAAFLLGGLDPTVTVRSLVLQSKYREAIHAANSLPSSIQASVRDVIESAKIHEWRRTLDRQVLESIQDSNVVVAEVLSLDPKAVESALGTAYAIQQFREFLRVALRRTMETVGESNSGALRETLVRLGTFELLCQRFSIEPSLHSYSEEFAHVAVVDIASSLSQRLDFLGLSILRFRHWNEFDVSFDAILERIPVSVDPSSYFHLLPTTSLGKFVCIDGPDFGLSDRERFCAFARAQYGVPVVLDDVDYRLTLNIADVDPIDEASAHGWYKIRLLRIAHSTWSTSYTTTFAACALAAMGGPTRETQASESTTSVVENWRCIIQCLDALLFLFREAPTDELDVGVSIYDLQADPTGTVDLQPLVREVIRRVHDSDQARELYVHALTPFVARQADVRAQDDIGTLVCRCCIEMLRDASAAVNKANAVLCFAIRRCSLVLHLSRTSLPVRDRWIKSISLLARVAAAAFDAAVIAFRSFPAGNVRNVLEDCWILYESLPVQTGDRCDNDTDLKDVGRIADQAFEILVMLDILTCWSCASMISLQLDAGTLAQEIFGSICQSLVSRTSLIRGKDFDRQVKSALATLASNVSTLKRLHRFETVDVELIASKCLMTALIMSSMVEVVALALSTPGNEWLNLSVVRETTLTGLDKCIENERECNVGQVSADASSCSDILTRFFPDSALRVNDSQRRLRVLDFLHNVLLKGRRSRVNVVAVMRQRPLDVIDVILSEHPELIAFGCDQWSDPRNSELEDKRRPESHLQRTAGQPGDALLQLGVLLGLESKSDQLAVTSLIVSHCLSAGSFGAAAFVCLRCITNANVWNADHCAAEALRMATRIVADDGFHEVETKGDLSIICLKSYGELGKLTLVPSLEHFIRSLLRLEWHRYNTRYPVRHPLFVSNRLSTDTDTAYPGTELTSMFQKLQSQSAAASVDGSLLIAVSKLVFYWAISEFTKQKGRAWHSLEALFANAVLSMAASLLLHAPDRLSSLLVLQEVKTILAEQERAASLISRHIEPRIVAANTDIVRRLQNRGYSELGARRALLMTGSNSFEAALQWAVLHCLDDDFEHPFIVVQPKSHLSIEWDCVVHLKDMLAASEVLLTRSQIVGFGAREDQPTSSSNRVEVSLEPDQALHGNVQQSSASPLEPNVRRESASAAAGEGPRSSSHYPDGALPFSTAGHPHAHVSGSRLGRSSLDATLLPQRQTSVSKTASTAVGVLAAHPAGDVPSVPASAQAPSHVLGSSTKQHVTDDARGRLSSTVSGIPPPKVDVKRTLLSAPRAETSSTAESPMSRGSIPHDSTAQRKSSPGPTVSRSSLRLHGRAALDVARSRGSPASEERRRLIEAGRQLLKSAATRRDSNIPTPTANKPRSIRPFSNGVEGPASRSVDKEHGTFEKDSAANAAPTQSEPRKPVNGAASPHLLRYQEESNVDTIEEGWGFGEPLNDAPRSDQALTHPPGEDDGPLKGAPRAPETTTTNDWDFDDADIDLT